MEINCYKDYNRQFMPIYGGLRTGQPGTILILVRCIKVKDSHTIFYCCACTNYCSKSVDGHKMKLHQIPWNTKLGNARRHRIKAAKERDLQAD